MTKYLIKNLFKSKNTGNNKEKRGDSMAETQTEQGNFITNSAIYKFFRGNGQTVPTKNGKNLAIVVNNNGNGLTSRIDDIKPDSEIEKTLSLEKVNGVYKSPGSLEYFKDHEVFLINGYSHNSGNNTSPNNGM